MTTDPNEGPVWPSENPSDRPTPSSEPVYPPSAANEPPPPPEQASPEPPGTYPPPPPPPPAYGGAPQGYPPPPPAAGIRRARIWRAGCDAGSCPRRHQWAVAEVHQRDDEAGRAVVHERAADGQLERHLACADRPGRPDRNYWLHYLVLFRRRVWSELPVLQRTAHRPATGA